MHKAIVIDYGLLGSRPGYQPFTRRQKKESQCQQMAQFKL